MIKLTIFSIVFPVIKDNSKMLSFNRQILDHFEKNILLNENIHFHTANERKFSLLNKVGEERNEDKNIKLNKKEIIYRLERKKKDLESI